MPTQSKNIYLICGDDQFAVKNKSRDVIASICGENFEENPALEIIHGDPEEKVNPANLAGQIIEAVFTPPFLSDEKIVWAKNFSFESITGKSEKTDSGKQSKKKNSPSDEVFEKLIDLIKDGLPEKVILVLTVFPMDKRSTFYKVCAKSAEVYEFEKLSLETKNLSGILSGQIDSYARKLRINISTEAKNFLVEACGANHSRIINELEKIAAYIYPKTKAELDDCMEICSMTPELASWAFSEAIGKKDIKSAIKALEILITPKNPENKVLYSIIGLFTDLARIKVAAKALKLDKCNRYPEFDYELKNIAPELKEKYAWTSIFSMNPYRAFKLFEQSQRFSEKEFAEAFKKLLETNKALVSSAANPRLELENLAIQLCKTNKLAQSQSS